MASQNDMMYHQKPFIAHLPTLANAGTSADSNKKNKKKKNKRKKNKNEDASNNSEMITLKNPMFNQDANLMSMIGQQGYGMPAAQAPRVEQPASIIKNDNGMYTIRNPAFPNSFYRGVDTKPGPPANDNTFSNPGRAQPGTYYNSTHSNNNEMKKQPDVFGCNDFGVDSNCAQNKRYDDFSFLETLQPGQHLNSEVIFNFIVL